MNVLDWLNREGQKEVPNPQYNPKSKKNKQLATITIPDLQPESSYAVDFVKKDLETGWNVNTKDIEKYKNAGIQYNPTNHTNIDAELADAQSNWTKTGNALAQTIVSEFGLGTIKAFSDIGGAIYEAFAEIIGNQQRDYQNPVSDKLQEWQDKFNEQIAPIYVEPGVDIQNGGFSNWGWYMKNFPQLASTLTLLIPTMGVGAAVGKLNKVLNIGSKVSTARRWASRVNKVEDATNLKKWQLAVNNPLNIEKANAGAKLFGDAMVMRTIENYQEARDTHIQTYQAANDKFNAMSDDDYNSWLNTNKALADEIKSKNIDINDRDAVAKYIATKAADRTFAMDFSNIVFDIVQLYGLRNYGKGLGKAKGRVVDNAQRESLEATEEYAKNLRPKSERLGRTTGEKPTTTTTSTSTTTSTPEKPAKLPFFKNTFNLTKDYLKYNAKTIAEESTEGIEEAINYIAQQEGITYGKALLEGNNDYDGNRFTGIIKSWTNLQNPLDDYIKSAELQESAFWGVMGGFVFKGVGDAAYGAKRALDAKAKAKENQIDPITGKKLETPSWIELFELPQTKAAKAALNKRQSLIAQYQANYDLIESGKDIYAKTDENGNYPDFQGDIVTRQEIAKTKLRNQFVTQLALDGAYTGTLDMTKEFMQSDAVKQAMVKIGVIDDANVDSYVQDIVRQINKVNELYNRQSVHILNQMAALNSTKGFNQNIPYEYAAIIARDNVDNLLTIEDIDSQIAVLNNTVAEQLATLQQLGKDVNINEAKEYIKLGNLIYTYGTLVKQENAVNEMEANTASEKVEKARTLEQIKKQKDIIGEQLKASTMNGNLVGVQNIFNSLKHGVYRDENSKTFIKTDEEILKESKDIFNRLKGDNTIVGSDESLIQHANSIYQNLTNLVNREEFKRNNKSLFDALVNLENYQLQKNAIQSELISDSKELRNRLDYYNIQMNEARKTAITQAEDIIQRAVIQYNGVTTDSGLDISEAILAAYKGDKVKARQLAEEFMSNVKGENNITADEFMDALDVIMLSDYTKGMSLDWLTTAVKAYEQQQAQSRRATSENNSTSQNQNANTQSEEVNDDTAKSTKSANATSNQATRANGRPIIPIKVIFNNVGRIIKIKRGSNSDTSIVAYDNGDGTFELDLMELIPSKQSMFAVQNSLLSIDDDVNILEPNEKWEVVKNPIVKKQNGEYILDTPGQISKVKEAPVSSPVESSEVSQTEEATVETTTQPTQEQTPTPSPFAVEENEETEEEVESLTPTAPTQPIPSTGEVVSNITAPPATDSSQEVYDDETVITQETFALIQVQYPEIFSNADIDINEVIEKMRAHINSRAEENGWSQELIDKVISKQEKSIRQAREFVLSQKTKLAQAGAEMAMAARVEEMANEEDVTDFFIKPAEAFLKEYNKILIVKEFNGKKVVRLSDVLRICNNISKTNDPTLARSIYNVIVSYLTSPIGEAKYYVSDMPVGEQVIDESLKTIEEIQNELYGSEQDFRVNIADFIEIANKHSLPEQGQKYFEILDSLKVGDKLTLYAEDNELILSKDGVTIGNMPKPKVKGKRYVVANEGWITDVELDGNGNIISKVKDIISNLFLGESIAHDELRELLVKNENNVNKEIPKSLLTQFENNPLISQLISQAKKDAVNKENILFVDYKTSKIDTDLIFKHLTKLFAYSRINSISENKKITNKRIKNNLESWFKKLYNTYNTINNIKDTIEVSVSKISDGELIRVQENTTSENMEELPLVNEAVADINNAKVAIIDNKDSKTVNISGQNSYNITGFSNNSTLLLIPSRNETPSFAKIWGVKYNVDNINSNPKLASISSAILNGFYTKVRELGENGKLGNLSDLENYIRNIINTNDTTERISLFRTTKPKSSFKVEHNLRKGTDEVLGINIVYYEKGTIIGRFRINNQDLHGYKLGYQAPGEKFKFAQGNNNIAMAKEIAEQFFTFISKYSNINISQEGIKSDNLTDKNLGGFFTKKDGKLILDIPTTNGKSFHEEYNSYNDFLIKNNLIRVNTKKNKNGSNFERYGNSQLNNQTLFVSLPIAKPKTTTTTTTESTENVSNEDIIEDNSIAEDYQFVKTITEENKETAGRDIAEYVLGEDFVKQMDDISKEFDVLIDILPSNITFVSNLNIVKKGKFVGDLSYNHAFIERPRYWGYRNGERQRIDFPKNANTLIGYKLLNLLSSTVINNRKIGIRILMHERLHEIINSDKTKKTILLAKLKEVYDIYKDNYIRDIQGFNKDSNEYKTLAKIQKKFVNYSGEKLYEEFLVESLTDSKLADYLNSIIVGVEDNHKPETLLSRIMRALAKLFGWGIKEGSLYMKQLNILRDALTEDTTKSNEEVQGVKKEPEKPKGESNEEKVKSSTLEETTKEPETSKQKDDSNAEDDSGNKTSGLIIDDEYLNYSNEESEEYDDYDAPASSLEEYNGDDDVISTLNIDGFKKQLPIGLQARFSEMEANGVIESKCR